LPTNFTFVGTEVYVRKMFDLKIVEKLM